MQTFQALAEPLLVNIVLMHYVVGVEFFKRFKASYGRIFVSFYHMAFGSVPDKF